MKKGQFDKSTEMKDPLSNTDQEWEDIFGEPPRTFTDIITIGNESISIEWRQNAPDFDDSYAKRLYCIIDQINEGKTVEATYLKSSRGQGIQYDLVKIDKIDNKPVSIFADNQNKSLILSVSNILDYVSKEYRRILRDFGDGKRSAYAELRGFGHEKAISALKENGFSINDEVGERKW